MIKLTDSAAERFVPWFIRLIALITLINGLAAIIRPLASRLPERLETVVLPVEYQYLTHSLDLVLGITLIYLAYQILERKVYAWWAAFIVVSLIGSMHAITSWKSSDILITGITLGALIVAKPYFRSRSASNSIWRGIGFAATGLVVCLFYGTLGFWLMDKRQFGINFSLWRSLESSAQAFILSGNPGLVPQTHYAQWFLQSLGWIGVASLIYAAYSVFQPVAYRYATLPQERLRVESVLAEFSTSTEDYFKLWPPDKSYFFAPGRGAFIAYAVEEGVAFSLLDPTGPPSAIPELLEQFVIFCQYHGWTPVFLYISSRYRESFESQQFAVLKVGEDAIVDLAKFSEQTSRNKQFRNITNRFAKAGYTTSLYHPPHSKTVIDQLRRVSDAWLDQPDRKEWKFIAGSFDPSYLQQSSVIIVKDASGQAQAFANLIPGYLPGATTIDLMRYRPAAPSNIMDFLFLQLFTQLREQGFTTFNLGLAPFSGLGEGTQRPEERLLGLLSRVDQPFLSVQGLRKFKTKYEPTWEPKYAAYMGTPAKLPAIVMALNRLIRK